MKRSASEISTVASLSNRQKKRQTSINKQMKNIVTHDVPHDVHPCGLLNCVANVIDGNPDFASPEAYVQYYVAKYGSLPSIGEQRVRWGIMGHYPKIKKYLVEVKKDPLYMVECIKCHEMVPLVFMKKCARKTAGVEAHCNACENERTADRRVRDEPDPEYVNTLRAEMNVKLVGSPPAIIKEFNKYFNTSARGNNGPNVERLAANPWTLYGCTTCGEAHTMNNFQSDVTCVRGFHGQCNSCQNGKRDPVEAMLNDMQKNSKDRGHFFDREIARKFVLAFMSSDKKKYFDGHDKVWRRVDGDGDPNMCMSPERIDRRFGYCEEGNMILISRIRNTGGSRNFDDRFLLQIKFAHLLNRGHKFVMTPKIRSFLKRRLRRAQNKARERHEGLGQCRQREGIDSSGDFSLTIEELVQELIKNNGLCQQTKLPMSYIAGHEWVLSIDRLDETKGYDITNIRLVLERINLCGKGCAWTPEVYKKLITDMTPESIKFVAEKAGVELNADLTPTDDALEMLRGRE